MNSADVLPLSSVGVAVFGLVLARVSGLIATMPVFGSAQVPRQVKAGIAVVLALIFTPIELAKNPSLPQSYLFYGLLAGRELLIGLALGFATGLIFRGIQMGSSLLGVQIGFTIGGIFNPTSGIEAGVLDSFYAVLAAVIFLTANGHHAVLAALNQTFTAAPLGQLAPPSVSFGQTIAMVQTVFEAALRIILPVMATLLLTDVALGLISRAAPQIQVFFVGSPAKVFAALIMLGASTPAAAALMDAIFRSLNRTIAQLLITR